MNDFLELKLFDIGASSLKVSNLINLAIYVIFIIIFLYILKRLIYRSKRIDKAKKFSLNKLLQYVVVILSFIAGLRILGLDITVLLAGSAALLVGLGFGLQHLFNDFISGVILLLDGTIKMDDIIEVNGVIYLVQDINFRTTTVIGRNEDYVILPNSELTSGKVVNWTHSLVSSRFKISVGVDYSTDIELLMKVLKDAAVSHSQILKQPEPFVRFEDYGDSALIFGVYFFSDEIFRAERIKSEIRVEIFKVLKASNISIPFPQRVVHHKKS
ncbi:MAG: mechanosensitive ion channel family protein [Bacteroidales bacterium]